MDKTFLRILKSIVILEQTLNACEQNGTNSDGFPDSGTRSGLYVKENIQKEYKKQN